MAGGNTVAKLPYEGTGRETADDSPTIYLRHLREISYILDKLRSNRTRFLLAAAHRRRQTLRSCTAKNGSKLRNVSSTNLPSADQATERLEDVASFKGQHLAEDHRVHQDPDLEESFSLFVEAHSESRPLDCLPGAASLDSQDAAACSELASHCVKDLAESVDGTSDTPAAAAAAATMQKEISLDCAPGTAAAGRETQRPFQLASSLPTRRESISHEACCTPEGDDVDLYLGELLVPLLHDGLVALCRLVEVKQNDRNGQRLGFSFHDRFDPLRWLGQYLMRHHPWRKVADPAEASCIVAAAAGADFSTKTSTECQQRKPTSAVSNDQNKPIEESTADRFTRAATPDHQTAIAQVELPAVPGAAESIQAGFPIIIAEASHSSTAQDKLTPTTAQAAVAAAFASDTDGAGTYEGAANEGAAITCLKKSVKDSKCSAAAMTTGELAARETGNSRKGFVTPAPPKVPSAQSSGQLESLHKRRMQQYASFYGVLKDIVDEERCRRDFLLRQAEVKHVFEAYYRQKNDRRCDSMFSGTKPRGSSSSSGSSSARTDTSQASGGWHTRLSRTLRKRNSTVIDGTLSSIVASRAAAATEAGERLSDLALRSDTGEEHAVGAMTRPQAAEAVETGAEVAARAAERTLAEASDRAGTHPVEELASAEKREEEEKADARGAEKGQMEALSEEMRHVAAAGAAEATDKGDVLDRLPINIVDFHDLLERLDAHWDMRGRLLRVFEEELPLSIAIEHADSIKYLLPQLEEEVMIQDPEDVQPDEFWDFVRCYTEVHTWVRRALYNKKIGRRQITPDANKQNFVELLMKRKMVVVQQRDKDEEEMPKNEPSKKIIRGQERLTPPLK